MTHVSIPSHRVGLLFGLVTCAATACVGAIGDRSSPQGEEPGTGGDSPIVDPGTPGGPGGSGGLPPSLPGYDPKFACTTDQVVASSMRRLAKPQLVGAIGEFLSTLSAANLDKLMASVSSELQQLPGDVIAKPELTSPESLVLRNVHDNTLSADHVNGTFELGARLAELLAASDAYINDLVTVCGAGSTRASLNQAVCLDTFVSHYARKAFRRPATVAELADFKAAYTKDGLDFLLGALLLQPKLYYRADIDGEKVAGTDGLDATYRLEKYELLSRIAFQFWNRPPDDGLYEIAASAGATLPMDQVLDHVFASPYAREAVRRFFSDWLRLDRIAPLKGITSPAWKTLATGVGIDLAANNHLQSMIDEVMDMGEYFSFSPGGRYDDILTSAYSFTRKPDLANLYGVAPWDGNAGTLAQFPAAAPRGGLLTRGALVISPSHEEYTRPVLKGRDIRTDVLCEPIAPPPPAVANNPNAFLTRDIGRTTRGDTEAATATGACRTCHEQFTPLGYASEDYDSLGRYRQEELKFDAAGAIAARIPVDTHVQPALFDGDDAVVKDAVEFGQHLADSGKGHNCFVRQYFRYTQARAEDEATDGCALESMRLRLMEGGGGLMTMFKETVRSQAFAHRQVR